MRDRRVEDHKMEATSLHKEMYNNVHMCMILCILNIIIVPAYKHMHVCGGRIKNI